LKSIANLFVNSNIILILILLIISMFFFFFLRTIKWYVLLKSQKITVPFKELFLMFSASFFLSSTMPGRLGDIVRVFQINKKGHSIGKSFVSVIIDRVQDVIFLLVLGLIALFYFSTLFSKSTIYLSILFLAVIIGFILLFFMKKGTINFFKKIMSFFIPKKFKKSLSVILDDLFYDIKKMNFSTLLLSVFLTIFSWFSYYFLLFLIALEIGINISFFNLVIFMGIVSLVTILPLSFSGIGTRDAVLIIMFKHIGLTSELAVAYSTIILITYLIGMGIGLGALLIRPMEISRNGKYLNE